MKSKLVIIVGVLIAIVLSLIGYSLVNSSKIIKATADTRNIININLQASIVSSEYYQTQLELWEYAINPTDERLEAFDYHNDLLGKKINKLKVMSKNYDSVPSLSSILDKENEVSNSWDKIVLDVKELNKAKKEGLSKNEISKREASIKNSLALSEELIDSFDTDTKITQFIDNQVVKIAESRAIYESKMETNRCILLVLAGAYSLSLLLSGIWLAFIIKKIENK